MPEYMFCALLSSFARPADNGAQVASRSQYSGRDENLINSGMCRNGEIGKNRAFSVIIYCDSGAVLCSFTWSFWFAHGTRKKNKTITLTLKTHAQTHIHLNTCYIIFHSLNSKFEIL